MMLVLIFLTVPLVYFIYIFKILKQGTQIAFEFHLSFQNLRVHPLVGSFFLLAKFFCGVLMPFFPIGW